MTASAAASTAIRTIARERITWSLYGGVNEGPPASELDAPCVGRLPAPWDSWDAP